MTRRTVIKSAIATSVWATAPRPALKAAPRRDGFPSPSVLLLTGTEHDGAFERATTASAGSWRAEPISTVHLNDHLVPDVAHLSETLLKWRGSRAIGFMEDGIYAVFQEMARDAGARLVSLGRHVWKSGESHHHVLSASPTHSLGWQLSHLLAQAGGPFRVSETILAPETDGLTSPTGVIRPTWIDPHSRVFEPSAVAQKIGPDSGQLVAMLARANLRTAWKGEPSDSDTGFVRQNPQTDPKRAACSSVTFIMDL